MDLRGLESLTVDAIGALVATVKWCAARGSPCEGPFPEDESAHEMLTSAGFYDLFTVTGKLKVTRTGCVARISKRDVSGAEVEKVISESVGLRASNPKGARYSYKVVLECTGNTYEHAPGDRRPEGEEYWWLVAVKDEAKGVVDFALLDLGVGIVGSVRLKGVRWAAKQLGLSSQADILSAVLAGQVESRTGKPYRGRGLEKIVSLARSGQIRDLMIVANGALEHVDTGETTDLARTFRGSLLSWRVNLGVG